MQLNAEVPDGARLDQLKTFVRQEVDVLLGWKPEEPDPGNVQEQEQYVDHDFDINFKELDEIAANLRDEVFMQDWDNVVSMVHGIRELSEQEENQEENQDRINKYLQYIIHVCNHYMIVPEPDPEGPLFAGCLLLFKHKFVL